MLITQENYKTQKVKNYFDKQAKLYLKRKFNFCDYVADLLAGDCDWRWVSTDEEINDLNQMCTIAWISNGGNKQDCVDYFKGM